MFHTSGTDVLAQAWSVIKVLGPLLYMPYALA